jgi:hypothetical protein
MLQVIKSICFCFFPSNSAGAPGANKGPKYEKLPSQAVQMTDSKTDWADESFEDNWDDLEAGKSATGRKSSNGGGSASASLSAPSKAKSPVTVQVKTLPARESKQLPKADSGRNLQHGKNTIINDGSGDTISPTGSTGNSIGRAKSSISPTPPAQTADSARTDVDIFSNLGMAPTYKEPEIIRAPVRPAPVVQQTNNDVLGRAVSHLDSLLETDDAIAPVGGWKDSGLTDDFGIDLDDSADTSFDLKPTSSAHQPKKPAAKLKEKSLQVASIDQGGDDLDDDILDSL